MEIVYEDSDILVINKPPGLVVDRDRKPAGLENYFIIHRLDKDTSGLLVLAKTPATAENLKKQFKERKVKKGYWALVHGRPKHLSGVIEAAVGRNPKKTKKFAVVGGGRSSVTKYQVLNLEGGNWKLEEKMEARSSIDQASSLQSQFKPPTSSIRHPLAGEHLTLLDVTPLTGRTHQIRVHLKSIGHSVVGDKLYASRRQQKEDAKIIPRQFLHAYRLGFEHPKSKEWLSFETDMPKDLENVLGKIKEQKANSKKQIYKSKFKEIFALYSVVFLFAL